MEITISFINLEHTPALDKRIREKSKKLDKYFEKNAHVKWSCYVKDNNHYAEVRVSGPNLDYHATAHTDSLYKTLDLTIDKLEKQLAKRKDKMKNKLHRKNIDVEYHNIDEAWAEHDDDDFGETA